MRGGRKTGGGSEHIWILALACLAVAGSFVLSPWSDGALCLMLPGAAGPVILPETCTSRILFGVSCPGCGLTRSFVATARGEWHRAFVFNFMGPVLFVLCCLQIPYRILAYLDPAVVRPVFEKMRKGTEGLVWLIVAGLVVSWAAKLLLEVRWSRVF
ncbi:MAG TPA: DUF2752 domain-containing protein [Desulfomonilaceae bacterium]|nr:DUF2752 domain-containing protein [Desulfomonilaceae bacterium]